MNTYHFTPEELLYAFLDGELDSTSEDTLFSMLSQNTDLRLEMRELLKIRSEIQKDVLYPPSVVTDRVFSGMGFSTKSLQMGEGVFPSVRTWWPSVSRAGKPLLSALLGSALTILFFMLHPQQSVHTGNIGNIAPTAQLSLSQSAPVQDHQETTPAFSGRQVRRHELSGRQPLSVDRYLLPAAAQSIARSSRTDGRESLAESKEKSESSFTALKIVDPVPPSLSLHVLHTAPSVVKRSSPHQEEWQTESGEEGVGKISLSLAGYAARSYPGATIESQSNPFFTNIDVSALYAFSDHQRIGIEGGREPFAQIFTGQNNGKHFRYEQNPLLYWGGITYQLTADPLMSIGGIQPFAQVLAGSAYQGGPLAGITMGVQHQPDARVSFLLGVEGKFLFYQFQQQWFVTRKLGIVYGVSLHL